MVGRSEFTRRQYLESCAQAGMTVESQGLPTYTQSTRYGSVSLGTPIGITSRAYKTAGSLPKSFSRNSNARVGFGASTTPREESNFERSKEKDSLSTSSESSLRSSSSPLSLRRRRPFAHNQNIVMTNPFKLETDSIESYIRSRKPVLQTGMEKFDAPAPPVLPAENTSSSISSISTRPLYSIRNMPLRNLDELRETIAIRRNYSRDRNLGNAYLGLDYNPTSFRATSNLSSRNSEESEHINKRMSMSPSPSPSCFENRPVQEISSLDENTTDLNPSTQ